MISYNEGRERALESLREWLNENYPQRPLHERPLQFVRFRDREKALAARIEKAKPLVGWRNELSDTLVLNEFDTTKVTNTVFELIEQALSKAEKVRIPDFGSFTTHTDKNEERKIKFTPVEAWNRELNAPLYQNELGFKYKIKKGKLEFRETSSPTVEP